MRSFAIIRRDTFAGRGWLRFTGYGFCQNQAVLPLVAAEVTKAAATMPIGLIRDEGTGRFQLVGLCSLDGGRNLFVAPDGRWLGGYVPAVLRGYPFGLVHVEQSAQTVLAVDEASGLVVDGSEPEAQPFFNEDGTPAEAVQQILGFLTQIETNLAATNRALLQLEQAGAIVPWPIQLNTPEGVKDLNGLFRVDIDRIRALDDEAFLLLRGDDALFIAMSQVMSSEHFRIFDTLQQLQNQLRENDRIHQQTISKSFVAPKSEEVKFDWSNL